MCPLVGRRPGASDVHVARSVTNDRVALSRRPTAVPNGEQPEGLVPRDCVATAAGRATDKQSLGSPQDDAIANVAPDHVALHGRPGERTRRLHAPFAIVDDRVAIATRANLILLPALKRHAASGVRLDDAAEHRDAAGPSNPNAVPAVEGDGVAVGIPLIEFAADRHTRHARVNEDAAAKIGKLCRSTERGPDRRPGADANGRVVHDDVVSEIPKLDSIAAVTANMHTKVPFEALDGRPEATDPDVMGGAADHNAGALVGDRLVDRGIRAHGRVDNLHTIGIAGNLDAVAPVAANEACADGVVGALVILLESGVG